MCALRSSRPAEVTPTNASCRCAWPALRDFTSLPVSTRPASTGFSRWYSWRARRFETTTLTEGASAIESGAQGGAGAGRRIHQRQLGHVRQGAMEEEVPREFGESVVPVAVERELPALGRLGGP